MLCPDSGKSKELVNRSTDAILKQDDELNIRFDKDDVYVVFVSYIQITILCRQTKGKKADKGNDTFLF